MMVVPPHAPHQEETGILIYHPLPRHLPAAITFIPPRPLPDGLTSSIREVQPVASIDGRALRGLSCPVTRAFQEAYRNCVTTGG